MVSSDVTQRLGSQGNVGTPLGDIPFPAEHGFPRSHFSFVPGPAPLSLSSRHPHLLCISVSCSSSLPCKSWSVLSPFRALGLTLAHSLPLYEGVTWMFFQNLQEEVVYKHSSWQLCDLGHPRNLKRNSRNRSTHRF